MLGKTISESVILQDRDLELFRGLFESRVMTASHIADIHFSGKRDYAKKRIQQLKLAGYLKARARKVNEPAVLHLARKAIVLLRERSIMNEYPAIALSTLEKRALVSDYTIRHELQVMDVKAAFYSATSKEPQFAVKTFSTWPLLHEFQVDCSRGVEVTVKPDGFIRITEIKQNGELNEHAFFLEVDRSTEKQEILINRASYYVDYYKSGQFAAKCGAPLSAFREYPFRILIVCNNEERRNNIAERLLRRTPPILTQVCLTTAEEIKEHPFGHIWIRPLEYREVDKTTSFKTHARDHTSFCPRDVGRGKSITAEIKKGSLLN